MGVLHESIPPIAAMSTEAEATESAAATSSAKTPADFLRSIRGKQVVVKLNSGVDYRGVLACLDGYMNIAMEQTEVGARAERSDPRVVRGERGRLRRGKGGGRMERRRVLGSSRGGVGQERRWRLTPPSRGRETGAEPYLEEVFGTPRLPRRMNE